MAINLSGMFAGLNNSIMSSADALGATDERVPGMLPRGPQDVMNPMLRAAGAGGAALVNKLPGANVDYRTSLEVAREAEKEVAAMPLNTAAGLAQAADVYGKAGMPEKQMAFRKMAMERAASEAAARQQQQQRETMAVNARRLGLTSLADELDAGSASLKEASKIISDRETEVLKQTKGIDSHKRVAKVRGVPQAVIDSFGDMTPDERMDIIKGYEGDTKPFVGPDGQSRIYSVVGGKVWDPAQSKYVMPSELNLQPAPVTSRQENVMNYAAKSIAEGKNARFNDAYEMARKAVDSVERNERAQRLIDAGIYTGPLAPFQTFAGKLAASLGMENAATATAAQTEAFLSERAAEIGEVIDMFGSGTGLSDADRRRAEEIVGASKTMSEESMRWLLQKSAMASQIKVREYNKMFKKAEDLFKREGQGNEAVLEFYRIREPDFSTIPDIEDSFSSSPAPVTEETMKDMGIAPAYFKYYGGGAQ